jgi:hypothetical protein
MNAINETQERLLMHGDMVDCTELPKALAWWAKQDDMGGFRAVGREIFPQWEPGSACLAPHREDRLPRFSINQNTVGDWYYKDHSNNTLGGLTTFVTLSGRTTAEAMHWLMHNARLRSPNEIRISRPQFQLQPDGEQTETMQTPVSNQNMQSMNGNTAPVNGHAITITRDQEDTNDQKNATHAPVAALADGYPQPMGTAAFHGVVGEIVRLIEPHTEADPAALLFQLLAAFGNLIGRDAHMIADGARHGLNLFGVLVGQSSKGRKGTSWNHVAALLERIDEDWKATRVTSGLSSGEGLIYNVRDPLTTPRPDDEKPGEYRQVVSDSGIGDKRLMIVEGEFANTLKVMERETNTLSPVIRAAWDSGSLRTLTKNAPVKATGAHISIIGHITRDELRRLLGAVEAANGFANRFCWFAVRRSKCLPEGGRIDTVDFNNVVMRLKAVIDFARTAGELTRDDATRDLWRGIYPLLSEGKPGLLGAVTGRAEAQVMRLSALYALLDGSRVIRPAHHYAAVAVWSYSEQSARWIFGTATGDKNADKILAALKQAGREGMTRKDIGEKVFLRHLSSAELNDALRVVKESGQATSEFVRTNGPTAERWYATGEAAN